MNLSTQEWYNDTLSLESGIDLSFSAKRHREDILTSWNNMQVAQNSEGNLCVKSGSLEFAPTEYCWQKICAVHHIPFTVFDFLTTNYEDTPERTITRGSVDFSYLRSIFHRQRQSVDLDKEMLFRTYDDGTMRTVMSKQYGIIDNGWFLQTLHKIFKDEREVRLFKWRGDEDTIYGNLLLMDTVIEKDGDHFGGMLSLGNCEIGKRSLSQRPSIFRGICKNGCIFGQQKGDIYRKRHRGMIDYEELTRSLILNIKTQLPIAIEGVDKFLKMKELPIDPQVSIRRIIALIAKDHGLTGGVRGQAAQIAVMFVDHESEHKDAFGIVNAITRAGQLYKPEEWVKFDMIGGLFLGFQKSDWDRFQQRAKLLPEKDVEKVFPTIAA